MNGTSTQEKKNRVVLNRMVTMTLKLSSIAISFGLSKNQSLNRTKLWRDTMIQVKKNSLFLLQLYFKKMRIFKLKIFSTFPIS